MLMTSVRLECIVKKFRDRDRERKALHDVNLEVRRGELMSGGGIGTATCWRETGYIFEGRQE